MCDIERTQAVADYNNDAVNKAVAESYRAQIQTSFGETDAATRATFDTRLSGTRCARDPRFEELLKNPPPVQY
jgi:hypothetical protein